MKQNYFDVIITGSGQGGGPLAFALAKNGKKVALIERKDVGGTCINVGCTPTRTMITSARVAHLVNRAEDYGINTVSRRGGMYPGQFPLKSLPEREYDKSKFFNQIIADHW
ncbi:MAG: FAD-dependent oxidoreductase [Bacillota bacterium]